MGAVVIQQEQAVVHIPEWIKDLASFRRWAKSGDFPDCGWYAYLAGELWVDPSMERLGHNQLKGEVCEVLGPLVKAPASGRFLHDRMLLTNEEAELSTEPDAMYLSYAGLKAGRCRLVRGADSIEVLGTPDMVLEVVSPTSRQKDTLILGELYWRAGIREYWLAEPGRYDLTFDILRRGPKGYTAARKQAGWARSSVFGRSFRLSREGDPFDNPIFTLAVR